ncbi:hypothetical protein OSB04_027988 [Centaurea solstitialis]|uniref:Reverse transcriptase zinc-binding domain-containing protein n=1 Tax=Centaurea solstitialis TaxID=347529 RepID=A0AA38SYD9_9ASTR|nr:hypothetical protein OSB04_027988 [Centaurea solstitialis]
MRKVPRCYGFVFGPPVAGTEDKNICSGPFRRESVEFVNPNCSPDLLRSVFRRIIDEDEKRHTIVLDGQIVVLKPDGKETFVFGYGVSVLFVYARWVRDSINTYLRVAARIISNLKPITRKINLKPITWVWKFKNESTAHRVKIIKSICGKSGGLNKEQKLTNRWLLRTYSKKEVLVLGVALSLMVEKMRTWECSLIDNPNSWNWELSSNGLFSISSLRFIVEKACLGVGDRNMMWNPLVPSRVNIFIWRIMLT